MANKQKEGLSFFPTEVSIFSDIKVRKLIKYRGNDGFVVYFYILTLIYRDGYYLKFDNDLYFIISEATLCEESKVKDVLDYCFSIDLFNKELFDTQKIITSQGIQKRFYKICTLIKRKKGISEFNLIQDTEELGNNTEELGNNTEELGNNTEELGNNTGLKTQTKLNKTKLNKIKAKKDDLDAKKRGEIDTDYLNKRVDRQTYTIHEAATYIKMDYSHRNQIFKDDHKENDYVGYQRLIQYIQKNQATMTAIWFSPHFISFPQYEDKLSSYSWEEIKSAITIMLGYEISPSVFLVNKLCQYLEGGRKKGLNGQKNANNSASYTHDHPAYQSTYGQKRIKSE